jgi:hypothetical protein
VSRDLADQVEPEDETPERGVGVGGRGDERIDRGLALGEVGLVLADGVDREPLRNAVGVVIADEA